MTPSPAPSPKSPNTWLHRLAILTAACTFPLIFVGGLVTTRGAALSVPDWPTSYGYNMFSFPLSKMVGGIFYEHSHRLLGAVVGMLTVALAVSVWFIERDRAVRRLAVAALLAVIVQGVLGGLRVVLVDGHLAIVHAVMAQTFFGLAIALAVVTSVGWKNLRPLAAVGNTRLWPRAATATAIIYAQLVLGAITRHTGAWIGAHIGGAVLVVLAASVVEYEVSRCHARERALTVPSAWLLGLVLAQIVAGLAALALRIVRDPDLPIAPLETAVPTIHVALGALTLGMSVVVSLRAWKMLRAGRRQAAADTKPTMLSPVRREVNV